MKIILVIAAVVLAGCQPDESGSAYAKVSWDQFDQMSSVRFGYGALGKNSKAVRRQN